MAINAVVLFCLSIFCILFNADAQPVINDTGLAALTLLVAESDPKQKETLIRLIMLMLAEEA